MALQLYCGGCREMFDQNHMRLVRDRYWCDACRAKLPPPPKKRRDKKGTP